MLGSSWHPRQLLVARLANAFLAPPSSNDVINSLHSSPRATIRAYWPADRQVQGTLIVVPGLHPLGPDDPRMALLCRRLASAGLFVACPALPDHARMLLAPNNINDLSQATDVVLSHPKHLAALRPGMLSVSVGVHPALCLRTRRSDLGPLVVFGGFYDFASVVERAALGLGDPLDRPVAAIHLAHQLSDRPEPLRMAWRAFCVRTWGNDDMKDPAQHRALAQAMSQQFDRPTDQAVFLMGCDASVAPHQLTAALRLARADYAFVDELHRGLATGTQPITIVHGRHDTVIPVEQAHLLHRHTQSTCRGPLLISSSYGHTASQRVALAEWPHEGLTQWRLLRAISFAATQPR